jgi:4-amino-4-deoxy-L-arabinose transferase-like glycosyltransferase
VADAVSPPGYPLFLSLFLRDKPDLEFMNRVILAQAILGVITTLFAFLLASRVLTPALACVPALLTALTPHLATVSTYLLTESLFTCLLMMSAWAFARAVQSGRGRNWTLAGSLFGLCCLVRPTLQILLPTALIVIALVRRWRYLLRPVAIAAACWALLLLPWLIYQQSIPSGPEQPNLLRTTLYHGSFPDFKYQNQSRNYGYPYRDDPHAAEIMASNAGLRKWVGARIRAEPLHYLNWYLLGKPRYFLSWGIVAGMGDIYIYPVDASPYLSRPTFLLIHALMFSLHWPLMLLGIAGALAALWRPRWLGLSPRSLLAARTVALILLSAILLHMMGAPYPRYGIPFRPLAYILAVAFGVMGYRRLAAAKISGQAVHPYPQ